ncbi:hypothetical protein E0500_023730 [Streptomyces sp. KM273126]|nr:hypothetical protein [Streptomyces sp. KM273126]MBA2810319.1 hypothetical protein [Streptomyces sp. KM273126]
MIALGFAPVVAAAGWGEDFGTPEGDKVALWSQPREVGTAYANGDWTPEA